VVGVVAALQLDPEERLHDEAGGDVDGHERNVNKPGDRNDRPENWPHQPLCKDIWYRASAVVALEDASVASSSLSPYVAVMQPASEPDLRLPRVLGRQPRQVIDSQG
jgi:hypothetical protein